MSVPLPIRAVTIELSQARNDDIDPRSTVDFFRERSFNTLVVFGLGYLHGETYFPSSYAPMRVGLDRDVFGEFVSEAAEAGLKVIGYVNSFFGGPDAWDEHPEWTQRWVDGTETTQGMAKGMCVNSPYAERIVNVAAEMAARYPIDGLYLDEPSLQSWCACEACRARFGADMHTDLPLVVAPGDATFTGFLRWRASVVAEFVGSVGQACRATRPHLTFVAQHAFPLASTSDDHFRHLFWGRTSGRRPPQFAGWYRPSFYGQDVRRVAAALDVVAIEPWRRFVGAPSWWVGAAVSYARAASGGKAVLPLMEYAHFPWGLTRLSDDELLASCADVVANGGELWWPMYAPGKADSSGWEHLGKVFAALDGARPVDAVEASGTAVVVSRRTAERYAMGDADRRYLDNLLGSIQLIRELHRPYRVLSADALTAEQLLALQTVILPGAACLSKREASLLSTWVEAGGHLVTIGATATHDGSGRPRDRGLLEDLLGVVQRHDVVAAGLGYLRRVGDVPVDRALTIPARDEQLTLQPRQADVLFEVTPMWDLFEPPADVVGQPSVTRHQFGSGCADHVALEIGRLRYRYELFEAKALLGGLLESSPSDIRGLTLGPQVALHTWRRGGEVRLFLINLSSLDVSGQIPHLASQSVIVPAGSEVYSVRRTPLRSTVCDGQQIVELAELGIWDCLIVS